MTQQEFTGDLDNPDQTLVRGNVRLTDKRGSDILEKYYVVHFGAPIGPWIEFLGIRIALRVIRSNVFDGIVPDFTDVFPNVSLETNGGNSNDSNAEVIDNS